MATTKSKKPTSKLKASKKKPLNKWIIVGGVAAVAVIGALVVRFSGASSWSPAIRVTGNWSISSNDHFFQAPGATRLKTIKLTKGKTYRVCVRGYSTGGTTTTKIYGFPVDPGKTNTLGVSVKQYGSGSALHCSANFVGKNNTIVPAITKTSGPNLKVTAVSVEVLK